MAERRKLHGTGVEENYGIVDIVGY
ncbi:uncharacterized protein G2W53_031437 [Senna tora]|uniref:Uncharacterized protein n=1 Tax=Senna tora TaxID=362788 RepID=A0A834T8U0_9FABA|nr:uncharacterized protein G2W53_031437 [Senna tora]